MTQEITDSEYDINIGFLCWTLICDRNRWYPPEQTAQECVDAISSTDPELLYEFEHGYHQGSFNTVDDIINTIGTSLLENADMPTEADRVEAVETLARQYARDSNLDLTVPTRMEELREER